MSKHVSLLLQSLCVTILAFLLSYLVVYDISSLPALSPLERASDIEMSDIYNEVANQRAISHLSKDIVLIGIDGCTRKEIAAVIDAVSWFGPRAIGLDVMFANPSEDDTNLLSAIRECNNLVLPYNVVYDVDTKRFKSGVESFFYPELEDKTVGVVNLAISNTHNVVRQFKPTFEVNGIVVNNFSTEIAHMVDEDKYNTLIKRNNELENICYPSIDFEKYTAEEIIDKSGSPRLEFEENIHDRIVLIGALNDLSDMHMVPIASKIPGIYIHAYVLHTILNESYISSLGVVEEWILAIIFCFVFAWLNLFIKRDSKWNNIEALGLRFLQVLLLYGLLWVGSKWFISCNQYLDFSFSLIMVGLSALAADVWVGICDVIKMIIQKCKCNEKNRI